jgi:hypothetical protein
MVVKKVKMMVYLLADLTVDMKVEMTGKKKAGVMADSWVTSKASMKAESMVFL